MNGITRLDIVQSLRPHIPLDGIWCGIGLGRNLIQFMQRRLAAVHIVDAFQLLLGTPVNQPGHANAVPHRRLDQQNERGHTDGDTGDNAYNFHDVLLTLLQYVSTRIIPPIDG